MCLVSVVFQDSLLSVRTDISRLLNKIIVVIVGNIDEFQTFLSLLN